jgi:hypothetical protein
MSCVVSVQKHKQEVVAEQAAAAALRQQLEDSQQARTDAAKVNMSCPNASKAWGVPGGGLLGSLCANELGHLLCKLAFMQAIM